MGPVCSLCFHIRLFYLLTPPNGGKWCSEFNLRLHYFYPLLQYEAFQVRLELCWIQVSKTCQIQPVSKCQCPKSHNFCVPLKNIAHPIYSNKCWNVEMLKWKINGGFAIFLYFWSYSYLNQWQTDGNISMNYI